MVPIICFNHIIITILVTIVLSTLSINAEAETYSSWEPHASAEKKNQISKREYLCNVVVPERYRGECKLGDPFSFYDKPGTILQQLKNVCSRAVTTFDKDSVVLCILANERLDRRKPEHYTPIIETLQKAATCAGFVALVHKIAHSVNGLETHYQNLSGRLLAPSPQVCATYLELLSDRGAKPEWAACVDSNDRLKNIVDCTGSPLGSENFEATWKNALTECFAGKRITIIAELRNIVKKAASRLDPNISCRDVLEIARKHQLADSGDDRSIQLADARSRAPRDDEVQTAVIAAFAAKLQCRSSRGSYCRIPEKLSAADVIVQLAMDEALKGILKGLDEAGVQNTKPNQVSARSTIFLSVLDVTLDQCAKSAGDSYECSYTVEVDCDVRGPVTFQGIDVLGPAARKRLCYGVIGPHAGKSRFRLTDGQISMVLK